MADALEFNDVFSIVRGALNGGRLKLTSTGIVFKSTKTGKVESIAVDDIEATHWMRVARGFGMKVVMKNGQMMKFDGFKEIEYEKLKEYLSSNYDKPLEEVELCVKGWNWGTPKFKGAVMSFEVDSRPAFEIPLKDVSQGTTGKNEVTIEFHRSEESKVSLMEMRFYVPGNSEDPSVDTVQAFHDQIMSKADIIQATGDAIVTFAEVPCLTPRGRYSIKVYPTFFQLHGKTYDYKIPHTTILRLFLLPHQDNRFMFFVVSMDPPIRQGQTRYPFLILQFERDEDITCRLNLTQEDIETKYNNKLKTEMSGALFEVFSRVLKEICGRKITVPGNFKGHSGTSSMTCSYKAASGLLYPLERGFIFVHKPPIHIRFDEIADVNFARGGSTGRTFDFELDLKNGSQVTFNNVPRDEYSHLFDFVNQKKLRIKNKGGKKGASMMDDLVGSDDDDHDIYLHRMKAEGRQKDDDDDDDTDSSEDEDFNPDKENPEDVREEYDSDSNMSDSSESGDEDEDEEEKRERKEKKLQEKQERKEKKERKPRKPKSEDGGSKKKKKKKKDADAPKRPMSAYFLWLNENRERIKTENPGIGVAEVAKKGGEQWKEVADKTEWEEKSKQAKARYEVEMAAYKQKLKDNPPSDPDSSDGDSKKKKKSGKSGSIKEMIGKKKSSPKKRVSEDQSKFKSKEYIDSSDSSSDDDGDEKSTPPKAKKSKKEKEDSPQTSKKDEDDDDDEEEDEDMKSDDDDEAPEVPPSPIKSRRGKPQKDEGELQALPSDGEDEAEYSGGSSAGGGSSDEDDD